MGIGGLMAYSAYRDIPMFGADGLVTRAIEQGRLQAVPGTSPAATQSPATGVSQGRNPHGGGGG